MKTALKTVIPMTLIALLASCGGSSTPSASQSDGSLAPESKPAESSTSLAPESKPAESSTPSEPSASESKPAEPVVSSEDSGIDPTVSSSNAPVSGDYLIQEPTTIYFWNGFNDNYRAVISNVIKAFKEIEPNVTVEHDDIKQSGNYAMVMENVIKGFSANNYPDIVVAYPDSIQMAINANKVIDMTPYINDETYGWDEDDFDDIIENYLKDGTNYSIPGTYSMPFCKSTEVMFYNSSIEGLDLSSVDPVVNGGLPITEEYINNISWEEFWGHLVPALDTYNKGLADDKKLFGQNPNFPAIVGYDSDDNLFITLAKQYGYGYTDVDQVTGEGKLLFNNDGMKELVGQYRQYYKNHWIQTQGTSGSYTSALFEPGNCIFCIGSTAGVSNQNGSTFQTKCANLPKPAQGERFIIDQGPSLTFLDHKDDNRALASWLFYKFLTNAENNAAWAINASYLPIRYSTYETRAYSSLSDPKGKEPKSLGLLKAYLAQYQLNSADYLFTSPVFTGSAKAREQVGSIMATAMTTDESLDKIFQDAISNTLNDM